MSIKFYVLILTTLALTLIPLSNNATESATITSTQSSVVNDSERIEKGAFENKKEDVKVIYYSENGNKLAAIYHINEDSVTIIQQDGKRLTLPHALSADGARFTADEKTIFWEKGPTAWLYINDELIFEGSEKE